MAAILEKHDNSAPQLFINHEVAEELSYLNAFEGPEKLLEVWFAPGPESLPHGVGSTGLKAVTSDLWVTMLDMVHCKILSIHKSDTVDAYLLSESSMFVFPHKLILKTCGTTTLLLGLQRMLHIAAAYAGFPFHNSESATDPNAVAAPYRVFYSRKNFIFPDKQHGPHRSWRQEVDFLDELFDYGKAYIVGRMNGDHWFLYITTPAQAVVTQDCSPELRPGQDMTQCKIQTGCVMYPSVAGNQHDETLEILMTDLDPNHAKRFFESPDITSAAHDLRVSKRTSSASSAERPTGLEAGCDRDSVEPSDGHAMGAVVTEVCGLGSVYPTSLYPEARVDSYLFSPCGYSANGLVPASPSSSDGSSTPEGHYWTVHVTPETDFSFASFETNVPASADSRSTAEIVKHIVDIFRPGRFIVTLFLSTSPDGSVMPGSAWRRLDNVIAGYRRVDESSHQFDDYGLLCRFYERDGFKGSKGPRVGEDA